MVLNDCYLYFLNTNDCYLNLHFISPCDFILINYGMLVNRLVILLSVKSPISCVNYINLFAFLLVCLVSLLIFGYPKNEKLYSINVPKL